MTDTLKRNRRQRDRIKQLRTENDALKARVARLEREVAELRSLVTPCDPGMALAS